MVAFLMGRWDGEVPTAEFAMMVARPGPSSEGRLYESLFCHISGVTNI